MTIVVSSQPHGTRRRALVVILRKKNMECATNSKAWSSFKLPELSVTGTPQPREAARNVTICGPQSVDCGDGISTKMMSHKAGF